jgi:UDP-N-acetylglucosamine diphosphorylase/glucosamine-1-phosphate N-acetyltransferase
MKIEFPWQIFKFNREAIADDFARLTKNKKSQPIPDSTTIIGEGPLFVAPGAVVEAATINTKSGPVYIGEDAEVMEGTMIRGPFALCHHSKTKLLTKVYGPVTVGPYSKIGGEVQESVIFGYSNKAHDGFMGNSVIGEWCNLGSDTNTSNLKNTYEPVRLWDYPQESFVQTGEQFIGLIMGDHSKCGINTMFNTGTVVGVSANIFGDGFQRNFVPSFSWGGKAGYTNYKFAKAVQVAKAVFARRNRTFDDTEEALLRSVFDLTLKFRRH